MAGSKQNTILLFKHEVTPGTNSTPVAGTDAVLIWVDDLKVKVSQKMADRNIVTGAFGAADKLPYARRGVMTFTTDLQASGTLGTAPGWGKILLAAGFAETVTASARVDYLPASSSLKTATLSCEWNDRIVNLVYAVVDLVGLEVIAGQVPKLKWQATGLIDSVAAGQISAPALTAWKRPQAASTVNTTKISIGAVTYTAGAITGGTQYTFKSLEINMGNVIEDPDLVGQETIGIYGRSPKAKVVLDAGATAHAAFLTDMNAGTARAFGLVHGSVSSYKVGIYAPNGVIDDMDDEENGQALLDVLSFALPPVSGNDELRIFCI